MNEITNTTPVGDGISDVKHFYIDAEGNRVEIPFDVTSDGEATQSETAFIAEDGADHPVTVQ